MPPSWRSARLRKPGSIANSRVKRHLGLLRGLCLPGCRFLPWYQNKDVMAPSITPFDCRAQTPRGASWREGIILQGQLSSEERDDIVTLFRKRSRDAGQAQHTATVPLRLN